VARGREKSRVRPCRLVRKKTRHGCRGRRGIVLEGAQEGEFAHGLNTTHKVPGRIDPTAEIEHNNKEIREAGWATERKERFLLPRPPVRESSVDRGQVKPLTPLPRGTKQGRNFRVKAHRSNLEESLDWKSSKQNTKIASNRPQQGRTRRQGKNSRPGNQHATQTKEWGNGVNKGNRLLDLLL